jgi:hypothetical protein
MSELSETAAGRVRRRPALPPWAQALGGAVIALPFCVWMFYAGVIAPERHFIRTCQDLVGRPATEAVEKLGAPKHTITPAGLAGRPLDYPWAGMNYRPVPTRPITGQVMLYERSPTAAYLFIDRKGVVEHVAIAGT